MNLNVYFHDTEVTKLLKKILKKEDYIMATMQELTDAMGTISTGVDKVSADTDRLLEQLANIPPGGLTPEQQEALDAATASAQAIATRLQELDLKVPDPMPFPT